MSKRQEIRARRRRERIRNRILVILLIVVGALLVVFALILPSLGGPKTNINVIFTPVARQAAVDGNHLGDPNAPVKMDVWEDFQCTGCWSYTTNLEPQVIQTYVDTGKVYYTIHMYPFVDGGQGESQQLANAAMCAADQNRFWDYHDVIFENYPKVENGGYYTDARLVQFAKTLKLDINAFNQCFQANTHSSQIAQDFQQGKDMGVTATPGIFVNSKIVTSSAGGNYIPTFSDISAAIDAALAGQ